MFTQHGRQTDELNNTVRSINPDHNFRWGPSVRNGLGVPSRRVSFDATGRRSQFENERASRVSTVSFGSCARYAGRGAAICAASLEAASESEERRDKSNGCDLSTGMKERITTMIALKWL